MSSFKEIHCYEIHEFAAFPIHLNSLQFIRSSIAQVEVKSRGYFALGVSKSGGMANADIVSGFVASNGSAILHVSILNDLDFHRTHLKGHLISDETDIVFS